MVKLTKLKTREKCESKRKTPYHVYNSSSIRCYDMGSGDNKRPSLKY